MGSQDKSPNSSTSMQRVKLYRLNENGKWDDQGTGHVTVDYLERSDELGLFVVDEEDNETLLSHRISSEDIYRKQENTIISWKDSVFATEMALSFQETAGCSYIWDHICNLQRNMHFSSLANNTLSNASKEVRELPPVKLPNLHLILKVVEGGTAEPLRVTDLILQDQDFFKKLVELFRLCEDSESTDKLHLIFRIVKGIILLNSSPIFEKIFGEELIMDIFGCLEYDPRASQSHHRKFLKEHVVFKEAIPIKNALALSKIHQNYRLSYLKDVIFPNMLDECTVANLNSIIHSNNAVIISLLKDDNNFIKELFARLKSPTTSLESKKNLLQFLHEFCMLSRSLQMTIQLQLFRDLVTEGIFDIITDIMNSDDHKLVLTGTDILILFHNLDPSILLSHVARPDADLLGLLVKNMLKDFREDMQCQCVEIIRSLLDTTLPGPLKERVVEIFYEKHLSQLIDAITSSCLLNSEGGKTESKSMTFGERLRRGGVGLEILLQICDLLGFCVVQHPYRIKCSFLLNNTIEKVLYLTRRREKSLALAAIRFFRALVSRSDEHLVNHIVRNNLFEPIVEAFVANGDRYNLLHSAILELFEYIRKENMRALLKYLVDTFWDQLSKFEKLFSIRALKVKYEQLLESAGAKSGTVAIDRRKRPDDRAMEKEEDFFNEGSDEEGPASVSVATTNRGDSQASVSVYGPLQNPSLRPRGIVDYDDDEDDEEYKPPPRKLNATEENDGLLELPSKRKFFSKEEPKLKRLQQSPIEVKTRDSVLSVSHSTRSDAVPSKRVVLATAEPNIDRKSPASADEGKCSSGQSDETKKVEQGSQTDHRKDVEIEDPVDTGKPL